MRANIRGERRYPSTKAYSLSWVSESGSAQSVEVQGLDFSASGIRVSSAVEVPPGTIVYIQAQGGYPAGYSVVRHCNPQGDHYLIGIELNDATKKTVAALPCYEAIDHYEFLQISPNAEAETIHRVYRFLAARYHTDNPETGDSEKFVRLKEAFDVLSDPKLRAEYDANLQSKLSRPNPVFESVDFLDGIEGELNRRLAVLSLLYKRCRANVHDPKVSLRELETAMGFPRDYLDFTTWYLKTKKYITVGDNSDFALTSLGVDYVESNYSKIPVLHRLLCSGTESVDYEEHQNGTAARYSAEETCIAGAHGTVDRRWHDDE